MLCLKYMRAVRQGYKAMPYKNKEKQREGAARSYQKRKHNEAIEKFVVGRWFEDMEVGIYYEHPLHIIPDQKIGGLGTTIKTGRQCDTCGSPITSKYLEDTCLICLWRMERETAKPTEEQNKLVLVLRDARKLESLATRKYNQHKRIKKDERDSVKDP